LTNFSVTSLQLCTADISKVVITEVKRLQLTNYVFCHPSVTIDIALASDLDVLSPSFILTRRINALQGHVAYVTPTANVLNTNKIRSRFEPRVSGT
jgi:hypothetical protein